MSFDWGGFLGSIVGVIGAYGIAIFQLHKQKKEQKPIKHKKTYELCEELESILLDSWFNANDFDSPTHGPLFSKTFNLRMKLREKIPQAIEADPRLYRLIESADSHINELNIQFVTKADDLVQMVIYRDKIVNYIDEVSNKLTEVKKQIEDETGKRA